MRLEILGSVGLVLETEIVVALIFFFLGIAGCCRRGNAFFVIAGDFQFGIFTGCGADHNYPAGCWCNKVVGAVVGILPVVCSD